MSGTIRRFLVTLRSQELLSMKRSQGECLQKFIYFLINGFLRVGFITLGDFFSILILKWKHHISIIMMLFVLSYVYRLVVVAIKVQITWNNLHLTIESFYRATTRFWGKAGYPTSPSLWKPSSSLRKLKTRLKLLAELVFCKRNCIF